MLGKLKTRDFEESLVKHHQISSTILFLKLAKLFTVSLPLTYFQYIPDYHFIVSHCI